MRRLLIALAVMALLAPSAAVADYQNLGQPYPVIWTRDSTTITTGGTSQQLLPANPGRRALLIENPCSATEDLYVDFGESASTTLSVDLPACQTLSMGIGVVSQQSINVNAATTAHAFIAFEGN